MRTMIFTVAFFWALIFVAICNAQEIPPPSGEDAEGISTDTKAIIQALDRGNTAGVMAVDRLGMTFEQALDKQTAAFNARFDEMAAANAERDAKIDQILAELLTLKSIIESKPSFVPIADPIPNEPIISSVIVGPSIVGPAIPSKSSSRWTPRDGGNVIQHYDSVHLRGAATSLTTGQKRYLHDSDHDTGWQPYHGTVAPSASIILGASIPPPSGGGGCPNGICPVNRIFARSTIRTGSGPIRRLFGR